MKNRAVKYICILLSVFVGLGSLLSAIAFICDPQNVYRWNENGVRYYSPAHSTPSAVKNYDYDLLVIGSSMVQNIDAKHLSDSINCKPLKATISAMTPSELLWVYSCAQQQDKARRYIISLDLHRFTTSTAIEADAGRFPEYMYSAGGIKQFKYLLGYETWFRFIPLQLVLSAVEALNVPLPASFSNAIRSATDINTTCEWNNTVTPGEETLYKRYINNESAFNEGDTSDFSDRSAESITTFLAAVECELDSDEELILFLPAYSALYWAKFSEKDTETLFEMRLKIAEFADKYTNVKLIDLQGEDFTTDLNLYVDSNHCAYELQKEIDEIIISQSVDCSLKDVEKNNAEISGHAEYIRQQAKLRAE